MSAYEKIMLRGMRCILLFILDTWGKDRETVDTVIVDIDKELRK